MPITARTEQLFQDAISAGGELLADMITRDPAGQQGSRVEVSFAIDLLKVAHEKMRSKKG